MTNRLDNFTDAAFAFALTLLVIGGTEAPANMAMLRQAVAEVPAFAIGFAIIAMFWVGHVRWRSYRGDGDWLSALLSILLVFLVLIYVQPLRAMARSFSTFLGGGGTPFDGDVGELFLIYGAGFAAMAGAMAGLFFETRRNPGLDQGGRAAALGDALIWLILVATGLASALIAAFEASEDFSPLLYATLPVTIGLFAWRYDWEAKEAGEPAPHAG